MEANIHKLRTKMFEKKINICAMAHELGIHRDTMSRYLKNPETMTVGILWKISDVLGLTAEDITDLFFLPKEKNDDDYMI